jgi:hypothetical protein
MFCTENGHESRIGADLRASSGDGERSRSARARPLAIREHPRLVTHATLAAIGFSYVGRGERRS